MAVDFGFNSKYSAKCGNFLLHCPDCCCQLLSISLLGSVVDCWRNVSQNLVQVLKLTLTLNCIFNHYLCAYFSAYKVFAKRREQCQIDL